MENFMINFLISKFVNKMSFIINFYCDFDCCDHSIANRKSMGSQLKWTANKACFRGLPSLTMLKTHGWTCCPISFLAQHCNWPKSASRRGVYCSVLDRPALTGASPPTSDVSRPVDSVQRKVIPSAGSASTWQRRLAVWSLASTTTTGRERRQTGESEPHVYLSGA